MDLLAVSRQTIQRLDVVCLGTDVKGGAKGIKIQPPWRTFQLYRRIEALGRHFGKTGEFDSGIMARLARPMILNCWGRVVLRLMKAVGMADAYWNVRAIIIFLLAPGP